MTQAPSPFLPTRCFLTKGVGKSKEKLTSFELALRNAGIAKYNIVRVSSIFPPQCKMIARQEGEKLLLPGQILFVVMSENASNEPNRLMSASIGVAIPKDKAHYGYLSEHHSFGMTEKACGEYAEDLAAQMLASTLGIEFDADASYNDKKEIWKIDGRIYTSRAMTQSAKVDKNGLWTTVVAAAVLLS
ncbi:MAG: arginine decarboxylase, pyruvoyl-dependent [Thermoplasmata archaeon]|nr:arginine decarboxylase, pyruvoyl-dependent [Thermoplasmata archaeon]